MVWNLESTLVWNPESRRLESGIQRIEIQNPDAGIRNLEAGIRNLGPSWILLHRAIGESLHTVNCKLNENAAKASNWYECNLLKGNLKKYQTKTIRNRQGNDGVCVNILGSDIESSDSLKLLGTTIDSKMNFNDHISTVCKKASQRVGVIMKLRNLTPTAAKLQLYKAAILPHLTNTAREPHYLLYLTDDFRTSQFVCLKSSTAYAHRISLIFSTCTAPTTT